MSSHVFRVTATISAPVAPTERTDRVIEAVEQFAPSATIERRPDDDERAGTVLATTHSLERLSERFHEQTILDTARAALLDGLNRSTNTIEFRLKKQAAYVGVVNFAVGDPDELGDITVTVEISDGDPEVYVHQLAPPTEDGVPIDDS